MRKFITKLFLAVFILLPTISFSIIINSANPGQMDDPGTWDCGCIPGPGDDLFIDHNVSTPGAVITVNTIQVNATGTLTHTNRVNLNGSLTVFGYVTALGRLSIDGDVIIRSGGTLENNLRFEMNNGGTNFQIDDGGTYLHNPNQITNINRYTMFSNGVPNFSSGSTVIINNWDETVPLDNYGMAGAFGNLTLNVPTTGQWQQQGALTNFPVLGTLTVGTTNSCDITLNNTPATNSITTIGALDLIDGDFIVYDAGGTIGDATLIINNDFSISSGSVDFRGLNDGLGNFSLDVGGTFSQVGGTFRGPINGTNPTADFHFGAIDIDGGLFQAYTSTSNLSPVIPFYVDGDMDINFPGVNFVSLIDKFTSNNAVLDFKVGGDLIVGGGAGNFSTSQSSGAETDSIFGDVIVTGSAQVYFNGGYASSAAHNITMYVGGDFSYGSTATSHLSGEPGVFQGDLGGLSVSNGTLQFIKESGAGTIIVRGDFSMSGGDVEMHGSNFVNNTLPVNLVVQGNFSQNGNFSFELNPSNTGSNQIFFTGSNFDFLVGTMSAPNPGSGALFGNITFSSGGVINFNRATSFHNLEQTLLTINSGTTLDISGSPEPLEIAHNTAKTNTLMINGVLETGTQQVYSDGLCNIQVSATGEIRTGNANGLYDGTNSPTIDATNSVDYGLAFGSLVTYNGSVSQNLSNYANISGQTHHQYGRLQINNQGTFNVDNVTTTSNTTVRNELIMTNGVLISNAPNNLRLPDNSISNEGNANSYVDGLINKIGDDDFVFPLGDNGKWAPIGIANISDPGQGMNAQYFNSSHATQSVNPPLNNVSSVEYWDLTRLAGTSNADVTLYWKSASESGINDYFDVQVAHLTGANWDSEGHDFEDPNNPGSVTVFNVATFSPFTFGSLTGPAINPLSGPGTYYWVGDGGLWSDVSHWSNTSGGAPSHATPPTATDNVFFDNNSFSAAGFNVDIDVFAECNNLDFSGANSPTIGGTNFLNISGDFILSGTETWDHDGGIDLLSSSNATLDPQNVALNTSINQNGTGTINLISDLDVDGSGLSLNNGSFNAGNNDIFIQGDLFANNIFNAGTSTVIFDGGFTAAQNIMGTNLTFYDLEINNSGAIANPVYSMGGSYKDVSNQLIFTNGYLQNFGGNEIRLLAGATTTGANPSSFMDGPMIKVGNSDFEFPVGNNAVYAPVTISNNTGGATDEIQVGYYNVAHFDASNTNAPLNNVSQVEYWDIFQNIGVSTMDIELSWLDASASGIDNSADLSIATYNGTAWDNLGQSSINFGPAGEITYAGVTAPNDAFTFGSSTGVVNPLSFCNYLEVTNTLDDGSCGSLRGAINQANLNSGVADTITFNVPLMGSNIIQIFSSLPPLSDSYTYIDGDVDGDCKPNITIDGIGGAYDGIIIQGDSNTIHGLNVDNCSGNSNAGIHIDGGQYNFITCSTLGTDLEGNATGFGNDFGVYISNGGFGNIIGDTVDGSQGNVMSGNLEDGVIIEGSSNNYVSGNMIGADAAGSNFLGNQGDGIFFLLSADNNVIGGTNAGTGNVIIGSQLNGIYISGSVNNEILGNNIGVEVSGGFVGFGNGDNGIEIDNADNNFIGDGTASGRNIISGNSGHGVRLFNSNDCEVLNNFIGTDITGMLDVGNADHGISIDNSDFNLIGDNSGTTGNLISGNNKCGIQFNQADSNEVYSNLIGTDATGNASLMNSWRGIRGTNNSSGNVIGAVGVTPNVVSGNFHSGIEANGGWNNVSIVNNYIGVGMDGVTPVPNQRSGIRFEPGTGFTIADNIIAYNLDDGIDFTTVATSNTNVFNINSIFSNGLKGIDFGGLAVQGSVTPPVITNLTLVAGDTILQGTGTAGATVYVYCDSTHEGQTFVNSDVVLGDGSWSVNVNGYGGYVNNGIDSLTALQEVIGNSSEFSTPIFKEIACLPNIDTAIAVGPNPACLGAGVNFYGPAIQTGYALDFDGSNDDILIPGFDINPSTYPTMTVTALVNISATQSGNWGSIITNDNGGFDRAIMHGFDDNWHVFAGADLNTGIPVNYDTWEHVTAVWSATEVLFYINGELVFTSGGEVVTAGMTMTQLAGGSWNLAGKLDEVSVWNKKITDAERVAAYNNTLTGAEANLVAYYDFEDGPGSSTLTDLSPSGFNGNLSNMTPASDWELNNNNYTFSWNFGDATMSLLSSDVHTYASSGVFTASLVINNTTTGCVFNPASIDVTVGNATLVTLATDNFSGTGGECGDLRFAMEYANANPGADTISFDTIAMGGHTIQPLAALPNVADAGTFIDGDIGNDCQPNIELDGSLTAGINALVVTGSDHTISGLVINRYAGGDGIFFSGFGADRNTVVRSFIGTDITGLIDLGNGDDGIEINGAANQNQIGLGTACDRNVISGNGDHGIQIVSADSNYINDNIIGMGYDESTIIANDADGINVSASDVTYIEGNQLSGNGEEGVDANNTNDLRILNNNIGLDGTGGLNRGNTSHGIAIATSTNDSIVGNYISGNTGSGMNIDDGDFAVIQSNIVGLNLAGTGSVANGINGFTLDNGSSDNTIGGVGLGNVVSGNVGRGIYILDAGSSDNTFVGNYIGTDVSGNSAVQNDIQGLVIFSVDNVIGTPVAGGGNVIAGNALENLFVSGNTNTIQNNNIGLAADGLTVLGNGSNSAYLHFGDSSLIGGFGPLEANRIVGGNVGGLNVFGDRNEWHANSITSNTVPGIQINSGDQQNIAPPVINMVTSDTTVVGTSEAFALIQLYADSTHEGSVYLDTTRADASGDWSYKITPALWATFAGLDSLTAIQDSAMNSSEFSQPIYKLPTCDTSTVAGTWTWNGSVSTDWFDCANWTAPAASGTLPGSNSDVVIPGATTNNPLITLQPAYCRTLQINAPNGGHLTLDSSSGGRLHITQ